MRHRAAPGRGEETDPRGANPAAVRAASSRARLIPARFEAEQAAVLAGRVRVGGGDHQRLCARRALRPRRPERQPADDVEPRPVLMQQRRPPRGGVRLGPPTGIGSTATAAAPSLHRADRVARRAMAGAASARRNARARSRPSPSAGPSRRPPARTAPASRWSPASSSRHSRTIAWRGRAPWWRASRRRMIAASRPGRSGVACLACRPATAATTSARRISVACSASSSRSISARRVARSGSAGGAAAGSVGLVPALDEAPNRAFVIAVGPRSVRPAWRRGDPGGGRVRRAGIASSLRSSQ